MKRTYVIGYQGQNALKNAGVSLSSYVEALIPSVWYLEVQPFRGNQVTSRAFVNGIGAFIIGGGDWSSLLSATEGYRRRLLAACTPGGRLSRAPVYRHLDLGPPTLKNCEK